MTATPNEELIDAAQAVLKPHAVEGRLFGDVASTLVTDRGTRYSGVCIDTASGTGFCAEHSAIAAMVTAGEYRIAKIVAVWRHEDGALHVLAPCGRCREFIQQIDPANIDSEVVLSRDRSAGCGSCCPSTSGPTRWTDVAQACAMMGSAVVQGEAGARAAVVSLAALGPGPVGMATQEGQVRLRTPLRAPAEDFLSRFEKEQRTPHVELSQFFKQAVESGLSVRCPSRMAAITGPVATGIED